MHLKQLGMNVRSFTKTKKFFNIMIVCFLSLVVVVLYVLKIQPLLSYFVPPKEYKGVEYYEDGRYLKFEKGEIFFDSFYSYEFADKCEITDFYYVDNKAMDNIIYGKMYDIYIIDLNANSEYEEIREYIVTNGTECMAVNEYEIYVMPGDFGGKRDYFFFVFSDEEKHMRYVLVTEIKGWYDGGAENVGRIIFMNSGYEW